ncbi:MAG: FmdB family zinc ribbon protein [Candidatus Brocadiia bacterium]
MPTYEYECTESGRRFEVLQGMEDDPLENCPECGGTVRRLISGGAGVVFKGNGFYATDSKRSGGSSGRCGQRGPCCGRDQPCGVPPCDTP